MVNRDTNMNRSNEVEDIDLEARLRIYMPAMFRLLKDNNLNGKQWRNLHKRFLEVHAERIRKYKENENYLLIEANFFDLISSAINGHKPAIRLVGYFDVLYKALNKTLNEDEKKLIRTTDYNSLINMDHKFRNFIGELAVLLNALEGRRYNLVGIERDKIGGGKKADFTLLDIASGKEELVEVVNIHLDEEQFLEENITSKITKKIKEKTEERVDFKEFTLVPVIWAPVSVLKVLADLYKSGNGPKFHNVHQPVAYCVFEAPDGQPVYRFANIATLFPEGRILVQWLD